MNFQPGDVLAKDYSTGTRFYRVIGWTANGKLRLQGTHTTTEITTWWRAVESMPDDYYVHARAPRS